MQSTSLQQFVKEVAMAREDSFTNIGPNREDDHFRKRDLELIEKMRTSAEREAERRHIAEAIGVTDDTVLDQLQELRLTCQAVKLLYLLPPLNVAWIDGSVTRSERTISESMEKAR